MTKTAVLEKKIKSKYVGVFPLEFDDGVEDENTGEVAIPDMIHLIPIGTWEHDLYGPIIITAGDIREFIQNFNAKVRKGVPITAGHEGFDELPAVAWIQSMEARDNGLWGKVEWNDLGEDYLSDKQFKFFSPEFVRDYEDPETHQPYRNVMVGGALTKSPYFKELEAIVFSEKSINLKKNMKFSLQEILAKNVADLSDDEKAFVKEHQAELTDEQKTTLATVLAPVETEEEKTAREAKEIEDKKAADEKAATEKQALEDANVAAGLNPDGSAKVNASDKGAMVQITATELAILRNKANQGQQAFAELEAKKMSESVGAMLFSTTNKAGKFLPKSKGNLESFMKTLSASQRLVFSALIADLPATQIFTEAGVSTSAVEGTAQAEIEAKVKVKMSEDSKLSYSNALRLVMSENPGLETRYDQELPSARTVKA